MRYLTLGEVLALHRRILAESGGSPGVRDLAAIASAVSQPRVSVGGKDAYPSVIEKAAALGYSLARNHGFIDGNKRIAHAAMEVFFVMNGTELVASMDEQERFMLALLASTLGIRLLATQLAEPYDYAAAFRNARTNKIDGGIMTFSPRFYVERSKVASAALAQSFPTLSFDVGYAAAGGLMSYGPGRRETWERAAYFIDRILKGDKPSELPVEEPRAYTLAVNVRTAKAIGMSIPESILARADEIIR